MGYSTPIMTILNPALTALKLCLQEPKMPMASFANFEKLHALSLRACILTVEDKNKRDLESNLMDLELEDVGQKKARLVDFDPPFCIEERINIALIAASLQCK